MRRIDRRDAKMMKKWQMLLIGSLLTACNVAAAQWVEVTGLGEDADSALRDAFKTELKTGIVFFAADEFIPLNRKPCLCPA